jgi:hypothetical protein
MCSANKADEVKKLFALIALAIPFAAVADYRVIPYGTQYVFDFTLRDSDATLLTSGLTLTAGDCKVSKDGGADANCGTLPTAIASSNKYLFTLSASEATAGRVIVMLNDTTTTAYYGREFAFDTCGSSSARFPSCPGIAAPSTAGTADSGTAATMVDAALTQPDANYWSRGTRITFTSGNIAGQTACVVAFTPGSHTIEFSPPMTQSVSTQAYVMSPDAACGPH